MDAINDEKKINQFVTKYDKTTRCLYLMYKFLSGEKIYISKIAKKLECSTKSIKRDIETIMTLQNELGIPMNIKHFGGQAGKLKYYKLESEKNVLSVVDIFIIVRILFGSRVLCKNEMNSIIMKLKYQLSTIGDSEDIKEIIKIVDKEFSNYSGVLSNNLLDNMSKLLQCIVDKNKIKIRYEKMNKDIVIREVSPISVIFSEYYFYLLAYDNKDVDDAGKQKLKHFRVDRIINIVCHDEVFNYSDGFSVGEYRKKLQYMYPLRKEPVRFKFSGPSLKAIEDKLVNCIWDNENCKNGEYNIRVDDSSEGLKMFLLSQGSNVEILGNTSFKEEFKAEVAKMYEIYFGKNK